MPSHTLVGLAWSSFLSFVVGEQSSLELAKTSEKKQKKKEKIHGLWMRQDVRRSLAAAVPQRSLSNKSLVDNIFQPSANYTQFDPFGPQ